MSHLLWYTRHMIMKERTNKKQNVVPTNEAQNMAAALECDTNRDAEVLFRALQRANNRGTTATHYAELERRWEIKQQTPFGQWLEKTAEEEEEELKRLDEMNQKRVY